METATEFVRAYASAATTPSKVIERSLERAERWQTLTNAFTLIYAVDAQRAARIADAEA